MKHFKALVLSVFLVYLTIAGLCGQVAEPIPPRFTLALDTFEKYVAEKMDSGKNAGLSVAFWKDDFVWAKGFGYADLENLSPARAESSYRLASLTKTITAIAILQLVEAGKIDLEAKVQTYVPYFPKKKWPITVRQLLGHLGGISHYKNEALEGHIKETKNTKQALAIFQDFDLVAEPGSRYLYSSYGFNLLGAVIEAASGEGYGDYIKNHIFNPLGMENTRLDSPLDLISNRVRGYQIIRGQIKNSEYVDVSSRFASGGTRSTVIDLIKYAKGIVSGKLLKPTTLRQMFESMVQKDGRFTGYGMGWGVQPWKGYFQAAHGGSQPETRTFLLILPIEKFAVAIASNLEEMDLGPFVRKLSGLILDENNDGSAYAPDRDKRLIYSALTNVFSYGLSTFDWEGRAIAEKGKEIEEAFAYFNKYVNEDSLKGNFDDAKKIILLGIHPVSNRAFIKVGSFMASALKDALGSEKLEEFRRIGPVSFFGAYARLSQSLNREGGLPRFHDNLSRLIFAWEKEWQSTFTDSVSRLFITPSTDFDELGNNLRKTFSGADFYPDLSADLVETARFFLERDEKERAIKLLNLNRDLYPRSPASWTALASAYLWTGDEITARDLYRKAQALDPTDSSLDFRQFVGLSNRLLTAGRVKQAAVLGNIAAELHSRLSSIYEAFAELFVRFEEKELAVEFYQKALELSPTPESVKAKLEKLRKELGQKKSGQQNPGLTREPH